MTESLDPGMRHPVLATGGGASAGTMIRQAREAAGIHIAAMAVSLKVPVKKIEALEADRLDLLPDAVFARALAASICRQLKLDPQLVLSLFPPNDSPHLPAYRESMLNTPFRSPGLGLRAQVSRPAVLAGLVFLVGTASLFLIPKTQDKKEEPPVVAAPVPALVVPVETDATLPASGAQPDAAAGPAPVPAPVPATAAPTSLVPVELVSFSAIKPSWVEVLDGRGSVVLRRQLAAGETAGISGITPLKVVVSSADVVTVLVRGQALALAPLSKDNVARFEVK